MPLVKCRECGTEISDKAPACPKCGAPKPVPVLKKQFGIGIFVVMLLVVTAMLPTLKRAQDATADLAESQRASAQHPANTLPAPKPMLELLSFTCHRATDGRRFVAYGSVKNVGSERIRHLMAHGLWLTAAGAEIGQDYEAIQYEALMPGQTATFEVVGGGDNPLHERCGVRFKVFLGPVIPHLKP